MSGVRLGLCALGLALMLGCEHDEHPFEVPWSARCSALPTGGMTVRFDKDFWEDDSGRRRRYVGEVQLPLDVDLYDSWLWRVRVNLVDETAETLDLEHVPIPDAFVDAYDLRALTLSPSVYTEDPEGLFADMSGTCSWGGETGELSMHQADDCDACLECSAAGGPASLWWLLPALVAVFGRRSGASDQMAVKNRP